MSLSGMAAKRASMACSSALNGALASKVNLVVFPTFRLLIANVKLNLEPLAHEVGHRGKFRMIDVDLSSPIHCSLALPPILPFRDQSIQ